MPRSVYDLVQALGETGILESQVSRLCEEINAPVKAFLDRPIKGEWPYLWIDATYVKVREAELCALALRRRLRQIGS